MINDVSAEQAIGMISAAVAVFTLVFLIFRHFSEARLSSLQSQYEAKQLLRQKQIDVACEIMDLVGQFVMPENKDQFDRDWHDFATIYGGRAQLIDDPQFRELLTDFGDFLWDENFEYFDNLEGTAFDEFESAARNLCSHLNQVILKQFHMPLRSRQQIGARRK
tara:strand:+ start:314 stop:805 length:492 start_codon:yes stop_codon:yes gene_type:complete